MIPVEINLTNFVESFRLGPRVSEDLRRFVYQESISAIAKAWDTEAKNGLTKSREEYRRNLQMVEEGRFSGMIILNGVLPNMIEQGASPFDMKIGFEKSAKRKMKADGGWYLTIPFRFAASTSLGESSVFANKLPPEVHKLVKRDGSINKNNISELPDSLTVPSFRRTVTVKSRTYEEYMSKSSIFLGVTKNSKTYEGATQNTYGSFRRVSDKSDDEAFIHTGIVARGFAEKAIVSSNLPELVPQLVDEFLQTIF